MLRNLYDLILLNEKIAAAKLPLLLCICCVYYKLSEEVRGDLTVDNYEHADRSDELVADVEEGLTPELASGCLTLFNYKVHLPDPAYCKGHDHCTDRHQDALGDNIVEVKPTVVPH